MLKIQLSKKISQLALDWRDREDVLTGDFFGILDYLPRERYLRSFFREIIRFNQTVHLNLDDVNWSGVELLFWPHLAHNGDDTEPDVVIISNQWVVVVEVKLNSALGSRQPVREYIIGQRLARVNGVNEANVFFLLVSRAKLDISETFVLEDEPVAASLRKHALHIRWSQIHGMAEEWLRKGIDGQRANEEQIRMVDDLISVLRLRRALTFSGFSFPNQPQVPAPLTAYFLRRQFPGFLATIPSAELLIGPFMIVDRFVGFQRTVLRVHHSEPFFCQKPFRGFLKTSSSCQWIARGFGLPKFHKGA